MPSQKRTKTGKSSGGKKGKSRRKAAAASGKRPSTPVLVAWVIALCFLAALLYFAGRSRRLPPLPPTAQAPKGAQNSRARTAPPAVRTHPPVSKREHPTSEAPAGRHGSHLADVLPAPRPKALPSPYIYPKHARPKLAIVIDDFGPNLGIARRFASLPFPVTLSVLPFLRYSRQIAKMAHQKGREVILHLPMQPLSSRENPGPGALLVSMPPAEIRLGLTAALDTSPYFDGVNNHMGSKFSQDPKAMAIVLSELKDRKLFFIDSMTIDKSVGWKEARQMGVPTFKRNVFLDDTLSTGAIRSRIAEAVEIAKARGAALAIGHPHELTLRTLQASAPYFSKEGVRMVSARDLVGR